MGAEQSKLKAEVLNELHRYTDFSKDEIIEKHKQFLDSHPSGYLQMEDFKEMYRSIVRRGNTSKFSEYVFNAFDINGDGVLDFREFFIGLYITSRGTKEQKLKLAFKVYDLDGNGYITCDEMLKVMLSLDKIFSAVSMPYKSMKKISSERFKKLDWKNDGLVTFQQFQEYFRKDSIIMDLLEYCSQLLNMIH